MRNEYVSRRGATAAWSRNRNTVRHAANEMGPVTRFGILAVLVAIVGLIYVAQSTKGTVYDYQLADVKNEITELTAQKEDLAVEKARLTSIAAAENSEVASNMETASVSGYAEE